MRHIRMLGLCLAAVMAVVAFAASSAFAKGPEWGKCEAKTGGKYKDANCTEKAKKGEGAFEWKKGASLKPVKFSGGNVGSGGVLTTQLYSCKGEEGKEPPSVQFQRIPRKKCEEGGGKVDKEFGESIQIECASEHNTGEIVGSNKVGNISVKFLGCKLFGSAPCSNGPVEGEIQVNALKGELGYINKAEKKAGILLEPVAKHGEFAKFNCAGLLETVVGVGNTKEGAWYTPEKDGGYDGIISPITPVNTMTTKYEQVYTINPETQENIPNKFEGKHVELLEDYGYNPELPSESTMWSPAGEEITNANTAEEAGELKA